MERLFLGNQEAEDQEEVGGQLWERLNEMQEAIMARIGESAENAAKETEAKLEVIIKELRQKLTAKDDELKTLRAEKD